MPCTACARKGVFKLLLYHLLMISGIVLCNNGYVVASWYLAPVVDSEFVIAVLYIKRLLFNNNARVIYQS